MNGQFFANQDESIYSSRGLKGVCFPVREDHLTPALERDLEETCRILREEGFEAAWRKIPWDGDLDAVLASGEEERLRTLYMAESRDVLEDLRDRACPAAAWSHAGNREEDLSAAPYLIAEPALVDADSWIKIWQRERGLPWQILETDRLLVREFTTGDMEAIRALYDPEAVRFLEPPGEDLDREREILRSYIEKIYGFCGFGHWAVIWKETGDLIGRTGFSLTGREDGADASFGYLTRKDFRGRGLTMEVCRALLAYGRDVLGFGLVCAEADPANLVSIHMLEALGFSRCGSREGQVRFLLDLGAEGAGTF